MVDDQLDRVLRLVQLATGDGLAGGYRHGSTLLGGHGPLQWLVAAIAQRAK